MAGNLGGIRLFPGAGQQGAIVPVKKSLSKWATVGLDLSDAGFSKLHSKESHFSDKETKYDLEPEKFRNFTQGLIEKVNRIHAKTIFQANDDTGTLAEVLKEYTRLTIENMEDSINLRWPDVDPIFQTQREMDLFTDAQIKAAVVGNYINEQLTENAKSQL